MPGGNACTERATAAFDERPLVPLGLVGGLAVALDHAQANVRRRKAWYRVDCDMASYSERSIGASCDMS